MLIQDLRQMQESNLLVRKDYQQVPPKVEYSITPFGRSLGKSLAPLCAWGDKNRKRVLGKEVLSERGRVNAQIATDFSGGMVRDTVRLI
jgi:DNA-binding HxlR family transcriptional regulator